MILRSPPLPSNPHALQVQQMNITELQEMLLQQKQLISAADPPPPPPPSPPPPTGPQGWACAAGLARCVGVPGRGQ